MPAFSGSRESPRDRKVRLNLSASAPSLLSWSIQRSWLSVTGRSASTSERSMCPFCSRSTASLASSHSVRVLPIRFGSATTSRCSSNAALPLTSRVSSRVPARPSTSGNFFLSAARISAW
jgi:hypothetical protein